MQCHGIMYSWNSEATELGFYERFEKSCCQWLISQYGCKPLDEVTAHQRDGEYMGSLYLSIAYK